MGNGVKERSRVLDGRWVGGGWEVGGEHCIQSSYGCTETGFYYLSYYVLDSRQLDS